MATSHTTGRWEQEPEGHGRTGTFLPVVSSSVVISMTSPSFMYLSFAAGICSMQPHVW
jgi:hypothetical protein